MSRQFDAYVMDFGRALPSDASQSKKEKSNPPGYSPQVSRDYGASSSATVQSAKESPEMLKRRNDALQNMAWSPIKQILMMSFMMYMAGTNLHFFSILTVINGMYSPINAILRSKTMFKPIPGSKANVIMPRLTFCAIHLGAFLFALYRVNMMGLLPTHASDWLSLIQAPKIRERAVHGLP